MYPNNHYTFVYEYCQGENMSMRIFLEDLTMNDIGFRIKSLRKARKITQKEFAERICVTQSYLSRVETGKEQPTDMLVKFIALEFNCSLQWLKNNDSEMDITESSFDYWDRQSAVPLKEGVLCVIKELSKMMRSNEETAISISVSCIIQAIITINSFDNKKKSALIIDELGSFAAEFLEYVERLENGKTIYVRDALVDASEQITESLLELYSKK